MYGLVSSIFLPDFRIKAKNFDSAKANAASFLTGFTFTRM